MSLSSTVDGEVLSFLFVDSGERLDGVGHGLLDLDGGVVIERLPSRALCLDGQGQFDLLLLCSDG